MDTDSKNLCLFVYIALKVYENLCNQKNSTIFAAWSIYEIVLADECRTIYDVILWGDYLRHEQEEVILSIVTKIK